MIPFRGLFWLFLGDFLAKTLYFLAFVYLARILGVANYGVLEFSLSILTYFLVLGDGGLEIWATREAARGRDVARLAGYTTPLRLLLASLSFCLLLALLPVFPEYPYLGTILTLFGLTLFAQAASLKWAFMGKEKLSGVAAGLVLAQIVFAVAIFGLVRSPEDIFWVPLLRLVGDSVMALYFWRVFIRSYGPVRLGFDIQNSIATLKPAIVLGLAHGLAFMSYNFDSLLLGFLVGSAAVGWYSAAYKPITAILAIPVTYFVGLFPTLSRSFSDDHEAFQGTVRRSLRLASIMALPVGVGGTLLAAPIIGLLFGPEYDRSVIPLQILSWSAVLVILRGTFRQGLNAAGQQNLDLRCAGTAMTLNVTLNFLLIPRYGILGAAATTLLAEIVWLSMASIYFYRNVTPVHLLTFLWRPLLAASLMASGIVLLQPLFWMVQGVLGVLIYFSALFLLGEPELKIWTQSGFQWFSNLRWKHILSRRVF